MRNEHYHDQQSSSAIEQFQDAVHHSKQAFEESNIRIDNYLSKTIEKILSERDRTATAFFLSRNELGFMR